MDAFGGLGQFSKKPEKMTLAERQRVTESNKQTQKEAQKQQWSGLDSLGSMSTSLPPKSSKPGTSASGWDALGDFTTKNPNSSAVKPSHGASSSLIDDFDVFASAPPAHSTPVSDPFADFEEAKPKQQPKLQPQNYQREPVSHNEPHAPTTRASTHDHAVAQLVDMGFSDTDASRALGAMDGSLKGAINYLMAEAQGKPVPRPKPKTHPQEDVMAIAQDVGAQVFATASSWWSKGRKQIQKTIDTYQGSSAQDDGQPAWMRSQAKHMEKESRISGSTPTPTPQQRNEIPARQRTFNEELPRRRHTNESATSINAGAGSSNNFATAPKSRAELFREKQAQRSSNQTPLHASPSLSPSTAASSRSKSSTPVNANISVPTSDPGSISEIDLLGMSSAASNTPVLSSTQSDMMVTSRTAGSDAFKRGDYVGAINNFSSALESIPKGHLLRVIILSNRSAALLKEGDSHAALRDTKEGFEIIGTPVVKKDNAQEIEPGKRLVDIWVKLQVRAAQALEHLEKHPEALKAWKVLLDNGHSQPTFLEGKRRCQAAIDQKNKPTKPASSDTATAPTKKSARRGWGTTGAAPSSAEGKAAVERVQNLNMKQEQNDRERSNLLESVSLRVDTWKMGKETDLRALLSTLQDVLWKECSWVTVPSADLVSPKKARVVYMKAVAKTHPDKIPSTATTEIKMISESVFITLNKAWELFKDTNGLA